MNSCISSGLGACTPPLTTLKCGTGSRGMTPSKPSHRYSGTPARIASARATAIDTPMSALAPSRDLVGVPSWSRSASSTSCRLGQVRPRSVSAISPLTLPTAVRTPCPE